MGGITTREALVEKTVSAFEPRISWVLERAATEFADSPSLRQPSKRVRCSTRPSSKLVIQRPAACTRENSHFPFTRRYCSW